MATRSRIGIELKDGSILSAYHHWDGYPEWLGRILQTHYNTREKASELIDGGDMSSCWTNERWGDKNEYGGQMKTEVEEYGPQYYSQRGEKCPPVLHKNFEEYMEAGEEYAYILKDTGWVCYNNRSWDDTYMQEISIPSGALAV